MPSAAIADPHPVTTHLYHHRHLLPPIYILFLLLFLSLLSSRFTIAIHHQSPCLSLSLSPHTTTSFYIPMLYQPFLPPTTAPLSSNPQNLPQNGKTHIVPMEFFIARMIVWVDYRTGIPSAACLVLKCTYYWSLFVHLSLSLSLSLSHTHTHTHTHAHAHAHRGDPTRCPSEYRVFVGMLRI